MATKETKDAKSTSATRNERNDQAQNRTKSNQPSAREKSERRQSQTIGENQWPEFSKEIKKQFPDIQDSDLPKNRELNDDFYNNIEKKYGHTRSKLQNTTSRFENE